MSTTIPEMIKLADSDKLIAHYDRLLEDIKRYSISSDFELVRALQTSAIAPESSSLIKRLLTFRLALKDGLAVAIDSLAETEAEHPYFKAEIHSVRALWFIQEQQHQESAQSFEKAAEWYRKVRRHDKELACRFNALIERANANADIGSSELLQDLRILQRSAVETDIKNILGVIHRQKSYEFQKLGRFRAALSEALKAMETLELYGAVCDFQLSAIQAANCAIDLQEAQSAREYLEYVVPPLVSRIEFPYAFVMSRLEGTALDLSRFAHIPIHWRQQYERLSQDTPMTSSGLTWDQSSCEILSQEGRAISKIKPGSLEGKLLKFLAQKRSSKVLLCERLWPDVVFNEQLDNRLFRLIHRVNQKIPDLVQFDGERYGINQGLRIL